jgi:hypothetical protein
MGLPVGVGGYTLPAVDRKGLLSREILHSLIHPQGG